MADLYVVYRERRRGQASPLCAILRNNRPVAEDLDLKLADRIVAILNIAEELTIEQIEESIKQHKAHH